MRRRKLIGDQRGFTLIEVLVALSIGSVVLFGVLNVFTVAITKSAEVNDRIEALQRGRPALDRITTLLDAQVCIANNQPPIVAGATATDLTFYADLGNDDFSPTQFRLSYDAATRTLNETSWAGTSSGSSWTFPAAPTRSVPLLRDVAPPTTTGPIFRYFAYSSADPPTPDAEITALPLSATDAARVVRVKASIAAQPTRTKKTDDRSTIIDGDGFVATADPRDPLGGPRCSAGA